jgi:glycosyltransferase involved in cell wall biosynthesis
MTTLRVGFYLFHYPESGGTTTALRGLSSALSRLGHTAIIYCCGGAGAPHPGDVAGPRVQWFAGAGRNPFHVPAALLEQLRNNQDKLDLLVVHGSFNTRMPAVAKAAKRAGIPYVVWQPGLYHPEVFKKNRWRKWAYIALCERPMLRAAAAVQVFSERQTEWLRELGVHTPSFVTALGVDPHELDEAILRSVRSDDVTLGRPVQFLYLGRMDVHTKGLDLLLEALSLGLRQKRLPADAQLVMVGPDQAGGQLYLQRMAQQLGIRENVRFRGPLVGADKWTAILSCDALVLPSRHDAFPTVVVEAMAAARIVVVTNETGVSHLVERERCGYSIPATTEGILSGLQRVVASPAEWGDMAARGRACVNQHLTWERIAKRVGEFYRSVFENSRPKSGRLPVWERAAI